MIESSGKICSNCGTRNEENSAFCRSCGKELSGFHDMNISDNIVKNDNTVKILIGVVVVIIIAIAIVGAFAFMAMNNNNNDSGDINNNGNTNLANVATVTSSSIPLSEVYGLAQALTSKLERNSILDISSVEYKGVTFTKEQCLYIFAKAIDMKNRGIDGNIQVRSFGAPNNPLKAIKTNYLTKSEYVDMAQRTYNWMDNNGRAPNYTGIYEAGSPDFGYDGLVLAFAIAILQSENGYLPSSISW